MLKIGDRVIAKANYHDEQLGEFASEGIQTITKVKKVSLEGTSGQWVRTDHETSWIDSAWFDKVTQGELLPCPFCGSTKVCFFDMVGPSPEQHIECEECGIEVWFDVDLSRGEIFKKWNHRVERK